MDQITGAAVGIFAGLVIGLILLTLLGVVLRWLWNTTLPEVLGVKDISLFQSIKILLIASILFGGHRVVTVQHAPVGDNAAETPASHSSN